MVRTDDPKFSKLSRTKKLEVLDRHKNEADKKLEDVQFLIDMVTDYKSKLDIKKSEI